MKRLSQHWRRDDGTTAVEYAVILGGIIAVCISAISLVGGGTANFWLENKNQLDAVYSP